MAPRISVTEDTSLRDAHGLVVIVEQAGQRSVDYILFSSVEDDIDWPLAGLRFRGRFLFLRRRADGAAQRSHHDGVACIG
jgi:hypothetical protein